MDAGAGYKIAVGPVVSQKIPYGSDYWPTFNGAFQNKELAQIELAEALYEGHPITTWHSNHWRKSENFLRGQHLGMDFDTEDERSTLATLAKDPFIAKHAAILHTTISHTPDAPRGRVIFLLDTPIHQATNYCLAASALLWLFGTADRQCRDAARFFFGGKPGACEMDWLGNVLSLDMVKDLIKRYQATGLQARRKMKRDYQPRDTDQAEVVEALKHIDPWRIDYDQWVAVLMALHSEMPDALHIAEEWADGKAGEVEHKWRSFKESGNVSGRVSIGTLFALAKENGWARQAAPSVV